jgi:hypothetical protein
MLFNCIAIYLPWWSGPVRSCGIEEFRFGAGEIEPSTVRKEVMKLYHLTVVGEYPASKRTFNGRKAMGI